MNRHNASSALTLAGVLAATAILSGCGDSVAEADRIAPPLPMTPSGITMVDVVREIPASQPEYLWTRLGDAHGATLFVSEADGPGVSNCVDACAAEFPPVIAGDAAEAFGDWSLITRTNGTRQWAYEGKALYTFAKETRLNEVVDNIVAEEQANAKVAGNQEMAQRPKDRLMPPEGWSVVRFSPGSKIARPNDIGTAMVAVQNGIGLAFIDFKGKTLYGFEGSPDSALDAECVRKSGEDRCVGRFIPALAPMAIPEKGLGEFSVVVRKSDHARQWAYRGVPLYTYSHDNKQGDALGVYGDTGRWKVMMVSIDPFPEAFQAVVAVGRGTVLADARSMPVYMRGRYEDRWGGFNTYQGYSNPYRMGRLLGTRGCNEECQQVRQPLNAAVTDEARGYWEIFARDDGTRQWGYKGFALYSYSGDKPGIVTGNNVLDYVFGNYGSYTLAEAREGEPPESRAKAAGLYWYVARP